jgi:hypothetical protein
MSRNSGQLSLNLADTAAKDAIGIFKLRGTAIIISVQMARCFGYIAVFVE